MDVRTPTGPLAQPSRARIFSLLCDLRRPAGVSELAEQLDLHPNGVRLHLEQLEAAGLVERRRERQAVGRPSDRWSVSPSALPEGDPPTAYRDLGRWLVQAMRSRGAFWPWTGPISHVRLGFVATWRANR